MAPIFNGNLFYNKKRFSLKGNDITEYLMKLIENDIDKFSKEYQKEIVKDIKENGCYFAYDFEEELENVEPFDYQLPDGNVLPIIDQRIKCTEAFFYDVNIGKEIVFEIENCGKKFRKDFYNIYAYMVKIL